MLTLLSMPDRAAIHRAGRSILAEAGVTVRDETVYKMLAEAGALVCGGDGKRLLFPEKMIDAYLPLCPKSFELKNRAGDKTVVQNGAKPFYYTSNGTLYARGNSKRAADICENDFVDFVRVADSLANIDGVVGTSVLEYPPFMRDVAGFRLMATNTRKHLRPCVYTPEGARTIVEMAYALTEGAPLKESMLFSLGYSAVSPLSWSETALKMFYLTKGHGIPMMINSEPMAGGTSPVTLAGSLALADAEIISGIIINQVLEPGRPCIYNAGFAHVMDMKTTAVLTGAPENALLQAAGAEMAIYHGLPSASWALSDSCMLDSQAAYEKMITYLAHIAAGVNMIWGAGNLETSKTICPESAVIDDEIIGCCERFARGIAVDEEQIAYDVIKETAHNGSFLETEHTFAHFREQIRHSALPNRRPRALWEKGGAHSAEERAAVVVDGILNAKREPYLTGTQMEKLMKIEKDFKERNG